MTALMGLESRNGQGPRSYRSVAVLPGKLILALNAASPTASASIYSTLINDRQFHGVYIFILFYKKRD